MTGVQTCALPICFPVTIGVFVGVSELVGVMVGISVLVGVVVIVLVGVGVLVGVSVLVGVGVLVGVSVLVGEPIKRVENKIEGSISGLTVEVINGLKNDEANNTDIKGL